MIGRIILAIIVAAVVSAAVTVTIAAGYACRAPWVCHVYLTPPSLTIEFRP